MGARATKPATPAAVADAASMGSAATVPPPAPPPSIEPGTMIADRYRVERVLGQGGMGIVYAAEHVLMRKEVALKVLHAEMCSVPEVVARFEREAVAAAHIDHPNVAGATDFGRLPDGACYLVLELLHGTNLRDEIANGPIPLDRALRIFRGIASGVAAAHLKGVVHRDLKPENVMLVERDGETDFVKVLDFGIAKLDASVKAAPQADGKVLTRVGSVFGTPEYMAPEQAVGDAVDARADLYSLGVVFLEMLTGRCPYTGNALSILRERILAVGPPDMSEVTDAGARALIARLLVREADARMQTAAELVATIDSLLEERASTSNPGAPVPEGIAAGAMTDADAVTAPARRAGLSPRQWAIAGAVALVATSFGACVTVAALSRPAAPVAEVTPSAEAPANAEAQGPAEPEEVASASAAAPAPVASADDEATPKAPPTASAHATHRTKPVHRRPQPKKKTGPGGIYVPPPKDWFK